MCARDCVCKMFHTIIQEHADMLSLCNFKSGSYRKSHTLKFNLLHLNHRCSTLYCIGTLPILTQQSHYGQQHFKLCHLFTKLLIHYIKCQKYVENISSCCTGTYNSKIYHWYNTYFTSTGYAKLQEHSWKILLLKVTAHFLTFLSGLCACACVCVYELNKTNSLIHNTHKDTYIDMTLTSLKHSQLYPWSQPAH
jgi:hypothetical protein